MSSHDQQQAKLAPVVVIAGLAQHVNHAVDRRQAAHHFPARVVQAASIKARLRLGLEQPVGPRIADGKQVADGDVKPNPIVFPTGFQKQHALCRIG